MIKKDPVLSILDPIDIPQMVDIKQIFDSTALEDYKQALVDQLEVSNLREKIMPGMKIAITAGSRGIMNIDQYIKITGDFLKSLGANPFIIPAMGSHGGATAEGQEALLREFGITEESMGMPIESSMDVLNLGNLENGIPVYFSKPAYEADGIILVNRIKLHTQFRAKYESGLLKMLTIGLGKQVGADTCHNRGLEELASIIEMTGKYLLKHTKVLLGIGLIENAFEETCEVIALDKQGIIDQEPLLLEKAKDNMPKIKLDNIDVLIVDKIGKNYSGSGMDTNITGRFYNLKLRTENTPKRIVSLDLSEETKGNANGIGAGDVTTKRVIDKLDYTPMYMNCLTALVSEPCKIPMYFENDQYAIKAAIKLTGLTDIEKIRVVRIKNTLELENIQISKALLTEATEQKDIAILSEAYDLKFDDEGMLF